MKKYVEAQCRSTLSCRPYFCLTDRRRRQILDWKCGLKRGGYVDLAEFSYLDGNDYDQIADEIMHVFGFVCASHFGYDRVHDRCVVEDYMADSERYDCEEDHETWVRNKSVRALYVYMDADSICCRDKSVLDYAALCREREEGESMVLYCFDEGSLFYGAYEFTVGGEKRVLLHDGQNWLLATKSCAEVLLNYADKHHMSLDSCLDYALLQVGECADALRRVAYFSDGDATVYSCNRISDSGFIVCSNQKVKQAAELIFCYDHK